MRTSFFLPLLVAPLVVGMGVSCIRFADEPTTKPDGGDAADVAVDTGPPCNPDAGAPGSLCDKYGGFGTVKALTKELVGTLAADCRINKHFTSLTPERLAFVQECLELQLGQLLGCACIKYPAKTAKGEQCRDMKTSHAGKGISGEDFEALIDDAVAVMKKLGVADADIAKIGAVLTSAPVKNDVVEKPDADYTKSQCDGAVEGGATDAAGETSPY